MSNNKPLTISLQNLNTLYCKYLEQFILQHLPKTIVNEVNILLGMKSAIEAYKYLDNKLNHNIDNNILNNIKNERKSSSSHSNNNNNDTTTGGGSAGNIIITREKDNHQKDNNSNKRMNSLLKRANTYVQRVD